MKDIMAIKDKHKGQSVFIAACGPSLSDYTKQQLLEETKDDIVICIKQAQLLFQDRCDYHFINDNNLIIYNHNPKTEIIASHSSLSRFCSNSISYIMTEVFNGPHSLNQSVAFTKDFYKNEIRENNQKNLLGPGIMYGLVIPFVVHCGFSHIKFIGWDYTISYEDGHLSHFYEHSNRKAFLNPAQPLLKNEAELVIESSEQFYYYLKSKGITSEILSSKSNISDSFPRRILK